MVFDSFCYDRTLEVETNQAKTSAPQIVMFCFCSIAWCLFILLGFCINIFSNLIKYWFGWFKRNGKSNKFQSLFLYFIVLGSSNLDQVGYLTKPNPKYVFTFDNLQIIYNIIILQLYCNLMYINVVYISSKLN